MPFLFLFDLLSMSMVGNAVINERKKYKLNLLLVNLERKQL